MNEMFKSTGILIYDPVVQENHAKTRQDPFWIILKCDAGICFYYRHLLKKDCFVDIQPQLSAWGPHISISRGEKPAHPELWRKYDRKEIEFFYSPIVKDNLLHYWLTVESEPLKDIRKELGLTELPIMPNGQEMKFHLTLGIRDAALPNTIDPIALNKFTDELKEQLKMAQSNEEKRIIEHKLRRIAQRIKRRSIEI